jgi:hypothetical protein
MADYRKLAMSAILADEKIDEAEVKLIKKELHADGKVEEDELNFVVELRTSAIKKGKELVPTFDKLYLDTIAAHYAVSGAVSAEGADKIKKLVVADKKLEADVKKKFLVKLKKEATGAEFAKVVDDFVTSLEPPAEKPAAAPAAEKPAAEKKPKAKAKA